MATKKKRWIQGAVKSPGSFTRFCKSRGYKGVTAACIAEGKRSRNATIRRRANLAATFRKMARRKKR